MRCSRCSFLLVALLLLIGCAGGSGTTPIPPVDPPPTNRILAISPIELAPADPGDPFTFSATYEGTPLRVFWNFGGGATPATSPLPTPEVTAGNEGAYEGELLAWFLGDTKPTSKKFTYRIQKMSGPPSLSNIVPADEWIASQRTIRFEALAAIPNEIESWDWQFDGAVSPMISTNSIAPVRIEQGPELKITLTVRNRHGSDSLTKILTVLDAPKLTITPRPPDDDTFRGYAEIEVMAEPQPFGAPPILNCFPTDWRDQPFRTVRTASPLHETWFKSYPAIRGWSGTIQACPGPGGYSWACSEPQAFAFPPIDAPPPLQWATTSIPRSISYPSGDVVLLTAEGFPFVCISVGGSIEVSRALVAEPTDADDWFSMSLGDSFVGNRPSLTGVVDGDRYILLLSGEGKNTLFASKTRAPEWGGWEAPESRNTQSPLKSRQASALVRAPDGKLVAMFRDYEATTDEDKTIFWGHSGADPLDWDAWSFEELPFTGYAVTGFFPRLLSTPAGLPLIHWIDESIPALRIATANGWSAVADDWQSYTLQAYGPGAKVSYAIASGEGILRTVVADANQPGTPRQNQTLRLLKASTPHPRSAAEWSDLPGVPRGMGGAYQLLITPDSLFVDGLRCDSHSPTKPSDWFIEEHSPQPQPEVVSPTHFYFLDIFNNFHNSTITGPGFYWHRRP